MPMSHETLFKRVFRQTRNARGELAASMPREIAEGIAWDTLRAEPAEFVDPSLRRHYADLIFSVAVRDRATRVYLLFEHKSAVEPFTSLQLLRYLVQIQEWWRRDHRDAVELPVIVPVVVYHGDKPWQAARNVVDLFGEEARRFRPVLPALHFLLHDLAAESDTELRARGLTAIARLTLFCLQRVPRSASILAELAWWADEVREALRSPADAEDLVSLTLYIMDTGRVTREAVAAFMAEHVGTDAEELLMGTLSRIEEEAEARGKAKGRVEGRVEGEVAGRAATLLKLLAKRFGPLPSAAVARVKRASIEELDRWAERVLTAPTLDEALQ